MYCKHLGILTEILSFLLVTGSDLNDHLHFPDTYRTAKILFELKEPPTVRPQNFIGCHRPLESNTFTNCSTDERMFPAKTAWCECRLCHLILYLTCHNDGQWYANAGVDICDQNSHRKCGHCSIDSLPASVRCSKTKGGFTGEKRTCSCRKNCIGVKLMCDKSKLWKSDHLRACKADMIDRSYLPEANLFKEYKDGKYIYTCTKGYKILGPSTVPCVDGSLTSHRPECKLEDPITTEKPTTSTIKPTESTTISTTAPHKNDPTSVENLEENLITANPLEEISEEPTATEIEEDQDMNSDYLSTQNKVPTKKKFPLTIILVVVFILLILILAAIVLYKLSKHYVLVVQFGNKSFATKPGYTDVKGNECNNVDTNNDGIELRVKT